MSSSTTRVTVGWGGVITLPENVRTLLDIRVGDVLKLEVVDGKIVLEPERKYRTTELRKIFWTRGR